MSLTVLVGHSESSFGHSVGLAVLAGHTESSAGHTVASTGHSVAPPPLGHVDASFGHTVDRDGHSEATAGHTVGFVDGQ